jgi:hypothetical protein
MQNLLVTSESVDDWLGTAPSFSSTFGRSATSSESMFSSAFARNFWPENPNRQHQNSPQIPERQTYQIKSRLNPFTNSEILQISGSRYLDRGESMEGSCSRDQSVVYLFLNVHLYSKCDFRWIIVNWQ